MASNKEGKGTIDSHNCAVFAEYSTKLYSIIIYQTTFFPQVISIISPMEAWV